MRIPIIGLLLVSLACNSSTSDVAKKTFELYPPIKDSINPKNLLKWYWIDPSIFNLPTLANGADSIEIRFWPSGAFQFGVDAFIFRADTTGWKGLHYFSYTVPVGRVDSSELKFYDNFNLGKNVFLVKKIEPHCGWQKFYDSLKLFN